MELGALVGERKPNKFSGSKERLDWLKIDLNAAKIITVQDYKRTKNLCEWKYTYTAIVATDVVKDIVTTQKGQSRKKIS